jgi:NRPS condensation-like uncharacterized protein
MDKRDRYNEGTLSFRMPIDEVQQIVAYAQRHDATVSWAIRQLVRVGMEKQAA